jgi:hypothetical protein
MAFKWLLFVVDYNPLFLVLSIPFFGADRDRIANT